MRVSNVIALLCTLLLVLLATNVGAVPFGAFDPRSLAMGGAGVASGTSANAAYYNPALLSMYKTRKEIGRNSRFIFPTATAKATEAWEALATIEDENLEQNLVDAINAFPPLSQANSQDAQVVLDAAAELQDNLDELLDGPIHADANIGTILGIGHKQEGGSFIINVRGVGSGVIDNFAADVALLEDYVEAMQFVESNGAAGAPHPELFDANGNLIDQTDNLSSIATGAGLLITELGVAVSKLFEIANRDIAIGITPKILRVITYDVTADATTGDTNTAKSDDEDWDVNLDVGVAHQFNSQWRAGLIFKNIVPLSYTSDLGTEMKLDPQVRAGVAYYSPWGLYALDLDLIANDPVVYGSESQELALGGEWRVYRMFQLRAGIAKNLQGVGDSGDPLYSLGLRWDFGGILDLTYALGTGSEAAGIQLGYRF